MKRHVRVWTVGCGIVFAWAVTVQSIRADDPKPTTRTADSKPTIQSLSQQFRQAYGSGDYKAALAASEKLHDLRPDAPDPIYNAACMSALLGEKAKAYEWLDKAVSAGYADATHMANDYDLRTLWGEAKFRAIVQGIRDRAAAPKSEARPTHSADKPAHNGKQAADADKPKGETPKGDKPSARPANNRAQMAKVTELTQQVIEAANAGKAEDALRFAEQALKVADIGLTNYNVACMHARLKHTDAAFKFLERCIQRGGMGTNLAQQIEDDSDLESLRDDKRYKPLLEKARTAGVGKKVKFEWTIVAPEGHDKSKKAPLIVALHPYGGSMATTVDRWRKAAAEVGAVLVCPQGTMRMGDTAYQWGFDLDEIEKNVMKAIDAAMDGYAIDQDHVVLAGFSQGGWITWNLGLRHPDTFCGLIPVGGLYRPEGDGELSAHDVKKLRVFAMVGGDEQKDVIDSNRTVVGRLEKAGAKARLNLYDGVGHDFPKESLKEQVKALKFVLEN